MDNHIIYTRYIVDNDGDFAKKSNSKGAGAHMASTDSWTLRHIKYENGAGP